MSQAPELLIHSLELLSPLGVVRSRRMFGGWGLYVDDVFIALLAFDQLYLKADAQTREHFIAAGCAPFQYSREGQTATLGYFVAPEEAMESPALMAPWARMALGAALRAQAAKRQTKTARAQPRPRQAPRR